MRKRMKMGLGRSETLEQFVVNTNTVDVENKTNWMSETDRINFDCGVYM